MSAKNPNNGIGERLHGLIYGQFLNKIFFFCHGSEQYQKLATLHWVQFGMV